MNKNNTGVTLVELCMWVAISSIIAAVVVSYIKQSQNMTRKASTAQETISQKIATLQVVLQDLRCSNRTSLGSLVLNGDFERAANISQPSYWASSVGGNGAPPRYENSSTTGTVYSGYRSVSLQSTDGTTITYDSLKDIKLSTGVAYMLTARVRSSDGVSRYGLQLMDSSLSDLFPATVQYGSSTTWITLSQRYPLSGTYVAGTTLNNLVKVRLLATYSNGLVYFDNISFCPIKSVLISTNSAEMTGTNAVTSSSDPAYPAGFKFVRYSNGVPDLYRYRIGSDAWGEPTLLREYFNESTQVWEDQTISQLTKGLCVFKIMYDNNNQMPSTAKDTALTLIYGFGKRPKAGDNTTITVQTANVYPLAP